MKATWWQSSEPSFVIWLDVIGLRSARRQTVPWCLVSTTVCLGSLLLYLHFSHFQIQTFTALAMYIYAEIKYNLFGRLFGFRKLLLCLFFFFREILGSSITHLHLCWINDKVDDLKEWYSSVFCEDESHKLWPINVKTDSFSGKRMRKYVMIDV